MGSSSYKRIYVNGKRICEHRHLMEQQLGRSLARREHVHHIDGDRYNNKLNNLELVDSGDHCRIHVALKNTGQSRPRRKV